MGLEDKARELAEAIKRTGEFQELKQAKAIIDKNRAMKAELEEFNKKQLTVYSGRLSKADAEARMAELNRKYQSLSRIPEIDRYQKAAKKLNDLLSDLVRSVNQSIEASLK